MATLVSTAFSIGVIVALVALSAFFSSSETAIFTLPEGWFDDRTGSDDGRMTVLRELRGDPHRLLVTILVGNNVVNVAIASITTVLAIEHLPAGSAVTVATLVASFVVLILGEIVPKSYGLSNAGSWALRVARPISAVERLFSPIVVVFDVITRRMNARLGGEADLESPSLDE